MSGEHGHDHGAAVMRTGARHIRPLVISFGLIVAFLGVQVATGIITGSLALLSDAGHMATDALGLGMAIAAIQAASKARVHSQRTFGLYRLEILRHWSTRCCCSVLPDMCCSRRSAVSVMRPMSRPRLC